MEHLTSFFETLLSMALATLPVMAVVLAARCLLRKAPKKYSYWLWAVVAFRLVCPLAWESPVGLVETGAAERQVTEAAEAYLEPTLAYTDNGGFTPDYEVLLDRGYTPNERGEIVTNEAGTREARQVRDLLPLASVVWLAGFAGLMAWFLLGLWRLRRRVASAVRREGNVWECAIPTPFVLGLLRPRVYLPFRLEEAERVYVLAHERYHIRHFDHWVKPLALALLAAYWWNPAAWLCWKLFCRDMEMRCDEAVLSELGDQVKRDYSLSLVSFALDRSAPMALAFGEHDAGRRVKNVLRWKKARPIVVGLAVALVAAVAVVCGTNAASGSWIRVENGLERELAYACNLEEPIRAWALYEDVYENGELVSSEARIMDYFQGEGGASKRRFDAALLVEPVYAETGEGFAGALDCTFTGAGTATWTLELPKDRYTGMGSIQQELSEGLAGRHKVGDNDRVLLYTVLLSTEPDGAVTTQSRDETLMESNDTVVQYWLVTSTVEGERFRHGKLAHTLFGLRTDTVENIEAVEALLEALDVPELGPYEASTFDSAGEPVLHISFSQPARNENGDEHHMWQVSFLLMALIEDLDRVDYTWPKADGSGWGTNTIRRDDTTGMPYAQNLGFDSLREIGQSEAGIRAFLEFMNYGPADDAPGVQWAYTPLLSSVFPAFPFTFGMNFTELTASCTAGELVSFDETAEAGGHPSGKSLTIPKGCRLFWSPMAEGENSFAPEAEIAFTARNGYETVAQGTIRITGEAGESPVEMVYTAALAAGSGLALSQETAYDGGGVITSTAGNAPAATETAYSLHGLRHAKGVAGLEEDAVGKLVDAIPRRLLGEVGWRLEGSHLHIQLQEPTGHMADHGEGLMSDSSCLLLALVPYLTDIRWQTQDGEPVVFSYTETDVFNREAAALWTEHRSGRSMDVGLYGRSPAELAALLDALGLEERGLLEAVWFAPEDIYDIESASLIWWNGQRFTAKGEALSDYVETRLGTAPEIGATGCPFKTAVLYLYRADGTAGKIIPAADSCDVFLSDGKYYQYGKRDAPPWTDTNEALFALFGTSTEDLPHYVTDGINQSGIPVLSAPGEGDVAGAWYGPGETYAWEDLAGLPVKSGDTMTLTSPQAGNTLILNTATWLQSDRGTFVMDGSVTLERDENGAFTLRAEGVPGSDVWTVYELPWEDGRFVFLVSVTGGNTPFTDIMGYDGYIETAPGAGSFNVRTYYAVEDGAAFPIAETFGYGAPQDHVADLDGDGVAELVANVQYGADGARRAYVYQRREDGIYLGSPSTEGLPNFDDWGANAWWSEYDPEEGVFRIHYAQKGTEELGLLEFRGLERLEFHKYEPTE